MTQTPTDALRLMPVEPTVEMVSAATEAFHSLNPRVFSIIWSAMLAAAPASPLPGGGWQDISTAPRKIEFRCLLAHPFSVITGYWDGEGWRNERSAAGHHFPATHWMPLPAAPTGE